MNKNAGGLHEESLLRLNLVANAMNQLNCVAVPRRVDRNWFYHGIVPYSLSGFSPHTGKVFYSAESAFNSWLKSPRKSARVYNEGDFLISELFFSIHDLLHAWAFSEMRAIVPEIRLGQCDINEENAEAMLFCYILSETVATIGLDYWFLCNIDLNCSVPIGTCFRSLTVSYRKFQLDEYRRFCPALNVECKEFFLAHHRFYCSGVLEGFGLSDIRSSPLLYQWLKHEIAYGELQRKYGRQWLNHLAGKKVFDDDSFAQLTAPVACKANWVPRLVDSIADKLRLIVDCEMCDMTLLPISSPWASPIDTERPFDGWFDDLSGVSSSELLDRGVRNGTARYACNQFVSRFAYDSFDEGKKTLVHECCKSGNIRGLVGLVKGEKELAALPRHCHDVFLLN